MFRRVIMLSLCSMLLTACGGGGGGGRSQPPPPPAPQSQTIAFGQSGDLYKFLDDAAFANTASGGGGSGAISYTSDAPGVATVNATTGQVTIVGPGSAKVTANKAADAAYLAATANYTLRVAPRTVDVTGWVGPSDAELSFAPQAASLAFTRSSDLNCDPLQYASCANGMQTTLDGNPLTDPVATLHRPAMYWLKHGPHVTRGVVAPENKFNRVPGKDVVVFDGRLWVTGGESFTPAELWSSLDGRNWRLETADLPGREESRLVVFQNALWLIAGRSATQYGPASNEVWKSTDGRGWVQVPQTVRYPARRFFAAAAYNGRLWVVGGHDDAFAIRNDVWSSADGSTWEQGTASAPFSQREQHALAEFNGRMWVIGGYGAGGMMPDVWSSTDGVTWQEETASAAFGRRFGHATAVGAGKMWLIAGANEFQSEQRDVWSSTDGRTWIQVTASAEFLPRKDAGGTFWQGQLWMIGPRDSDVWSSSTGEHWSKNSVAAVIPSKWLATAIGFKDRLWVLDEELQFWSTADGLDWVKEVPRLSGFSPILGVSGAQLFVFGNRLVLVGGLQYSAPDYFREVWSSEDGRNWSKILDATPFRADGFSQVIVSEEKLVAYTTGQTPGGSLVMEIWSSTDAINWNRVTDTAAFVPNAGPRVIAYNGKFWAIGGRSAMEEHRDVWSSLDGVNWTQVNSTGLPPVTAIGFRAGLVFSDKLCLYGPIATYEAWCSADGRAWERRSTDVPAGVFGSLNGVAFAIGPSEKRYGSMDLVWKSTDGVSWRQGYRNTLQFD